MSAQERELQVSLKSPEKFPISPHGGTLIQQVLTPDEREKILSRSRDYFCLSCSRDFLLDAEKIAIGAYSPLTGFMGKEEMESVLNTLSLPSGLIWSLPIFLPVQQKVAKKLEKGQEILLRPKKGKPVAVLHIQEIFHWDREKVIQGMFGTHSQEHPGVRKVSRWGSYALAGPVHLLSSLSRSPHSSEKTPTEMRRYFQQKGWRTVSAFQTRNPPHRAHEHLQKLALQIVDGLLIHPITGSKKAGDFPTHLILRCYKVLLSIYFPKDRVLLAGLSTWMRYAGPKEAIFHAIVRKNYGCTHFIVGRDHAGTGSFYPPYSAQQIFDTLHSLDIQILKVREAFYCRACGDTATEETCPHSPENRVYISMTDVRQALQRGDSVPEEVLRPEISRLLSSYLRSRRNSGVMR